MLRYYYIVTLLFLTASVTHAQMLRVASVYGDHMVLQRDMPVPVWGTTAPNIKITIKFREQTTETRADSTGRWYATLPSSRAGGPFTLTVGNGSMGIRYKDVYVGEVWLCSGQSNMDMTVAREDRYWCGVYHEQEEVAAAKYPYIRVYDVGFHPTDTLQIETQGEWEICSPATVGHFSATAYFFARELYKRHKVPIGLITSAYGASTAEAWTSRQALEAHPQLSYLLKEYAAKSAAYDTSRTVQVKYARDRATWEVAAAKAVAEGKDKPREPKNPNPRKDQHSPCVLYNGMIAPLVPYSIRGVIWYQGESNGATAHVYDKQMEALIRDWRSAWSQGNFPFLYVQLANHQAQTQEPVKEDPMVLVREAQWKNLAIAATGMAVAIDNANPDDPNDIHPKNKQDIGKRLAYIALAQVYGDKIPYSGPIYKSMEVAGNGVLRIHFSHVGRKLVAKGETLRGFAIAGKDKHFVWANARIDGQTVLLSSPEILTPLYVRYGWARNPPVNLYNNAGLPASPFRTDHDE